MSKWLVASILDYTPILRGHAGGCSPHDAHGLYARFGLAPLENPGFNMELLRAG